MTLETALVGKVFNDFTVKADSGMRFRKEVWWHVECKCGSNLILTTEELTSGSVKNCGCCHAKRRET